MSGIEIRTVRSHFVVATPATTTATATTTTRLATVGIKYVVRRFRCSGFAQWRDQQFGFLGSIAW